jgi:hypothetical protein
LSSVFVAGPVGFGRPSYKYPSKQSGEHTNTMPSVPKYMSSASSAWQYAHSISFSFLGWTHEVLKENHPLLSANDMAFLVAVNHATAHAAEPPFRKEEDVAITLERKHGLLLVKEQWRWARYRTPSRGRHHDPISDYNYTPVEK